MSTERDPLHDSESRRADAGADEAFERRASELLVDSAEHVDARVRSRLTQARHAALAELEQRRTQTFRVPSFWLPVGSVAAATVLALAVWLRTPSPEAVTVAAAVADVSAVEDIAILAAADEPDLYAEEADFYEWAGAAADGALDQLGG
jgi:hypothetical protein